MAIKTKPLTKRQLSEIVACYHAEFSEWKAVGSERLVRMNGPIAQQIGFERLRSGAYRPSAGIRILVARDAAMLHQFLDLRNREIFLREHDSVWRRVVGAMEEQFVPRVRGPLRLDEVRDLCEKSGGERTSDVYALGALNAYLGETERALMWLDRLQQLAEENPQDLADWEREDVELGRKLRIAIETNEVMGLLEGVMKSEVERLA